MNTVPACCARTLASVTISSQGLAALAMFWSDIRLGTLAISRAGSATNRKAEDRGYESNVVLTELDDDSLGVGALDALECALILKHPFARLDLRQNHRQSALWASSLPDWRLCWIEILRLRHWC